MLGSVHAEDVRLFIKQALGVSLLPAALDPTSPSVPALAALASCGNIGEMQILSPAQA